MKNFLNSITKTSTLTLTAIVFSFGLSAQETVTDYDGNVYNTVTIGTQVWLQENLKTTHYRNGDAIPNVTDATAWDGLTSGAYCSYNNDTLNVATYGLLYNWYAVNDSRNICPEGWHIPTSADWDTLINYLGGLDSAGGKMKETGTEHWRSPNEGATNESGFTGLPGGDRVESGFFFLINEAGFFWSATEVSETYAIACALLYQAALIDKGNYRKFATGYSVRCLKDATTGVGDSNGKQIPEEIKLNQNFPNPFNARTTIEYSIREVGFVKLAIYDILGREVKTLVERIMPAGKHTVNVELTGLSSGIYFYRLETGGKNIQKKMILIR